MRKLFIFISFVLLSLFFLFLFWKFMGRSHVIVQSNMQLPLQCVSYSPYRKGEAPYLLKPGQKFSQEKLDEDLSLLAKQFSCIRIYSVRGMQHLPTLLHKHHLKLLLGLWINQDTLATRQEIDAGIAFAINNADLIQAIIVGNEVLLRKELTEEQLADYIQLVKQSLPQFLVTYADVWEFWLRHSSLSRYVDYVTIHILPYWEDDPAGMDQAIAHVENVFGKLQKKFPDKEIFIGETGWPSEGRIRETAIPSPVNQAKYLQMFLQLAQNKGWHYNLIEAFDQPWKRGNEGLVGGYWGIYSAERGDKNVFASSVSNYPDWMILFIISAFLVLILSVGAIRRAHCIWGGRAADPALHELPLRSFIIFIITLHSAVWVLQGRELFLSYRNFPELFWGGYQLLLSMLAMIALMYLNYQRSRFAVLILLISMEFCLTSLSLAMDARYRLFPVWGMLTPGIFYCIYFWQFPALVKNSTWFDLEKISTVTKWFVFVMGIVILKNEGVFNWQANFWLLLLLGVFLVSKDQLQITKLQQYYKIILFFLGFYILSLGLRYQLMESTNMVDYCSIHASGFWCNLRDWLGAMIHFRILARIAWLLLLASLALKNVRVLYASLALSMMAIVLYNIDMAGLPLILWLMLLGQHWFRLHRPFTGKTA